MTAIYLKDGRIAVPLAEDAILLTLAGIRLESYKGKWAFPYAQIKARLIEGTRELVFKCNFPLSPNHNEHTPQKTLYVPADVAKGLVDTTNKCWGLREDHTLAPHAEGKIFNPSYYEKGIPRTMYLRRYAGRWNLLPEIEFEK